MKKKDTEKLKAIIKQKQFGDPTGLEPPNLSILMDRVRWAVDHPGCYTSKYLENIKDDMIEASACLEAIRLVLAAPGENPRSTFLMERRSKRR